MDIGTTACFFLLLAVQLDSLGLLKISDHRDSHYLAVSVFICMTGAITISKATARDNKDPKRCEGNKWYPCVPLDLPFGCVSNS